MKNSSNFWRKANILAILMVFITIFSAKAVIFNQMVNPDPDFNALQSVWGSDNNNIFAVGDVILNYNGSTWNLMNCPVSGYSLDEVSGSSSTDVWTCGTQELLLHYNGSVWSQVDLGDGLGLNLCFVVAFSSTSAFTGGQHGSVYQLNGTTWTKMNTGIYNVTFMKVFGISPTDFYLVGNTESSPYSGVIYHYDGTNFTLLQSTSDHGLCSIWSPDNVNFYICGHSAIYKYNKNTNSITTAYATTFNYALTGFSPTSIISGGDFRITTSDGITWTDVDTSYESVLSICSPTNNSNNIFLVGTGGLILHTDLTSGINEHTSIIKNLSVYPNPATTSVTVSLNSDQKVDINLFDLTGQKVAEIAAQEKISSIHFDVSLLPKGLYLIQVKAGAATETKKIIIN
jgi:photosystem II stability/assembly factor-like uncharacterized protein